jgi:hypothetical protein
LVVSALAAAHYWTNAGQILVDFESALAAAGSTHQRGEGRGAEGWLPARGHEFDQYLTSV